jgi:hypothetical protein
MVFGAEVDIAIPAWLLVIILLLVAGAVLAIVWALTRRE